MRRGRTGWRASSLLAANHGNARVAAARAWAAFLRSFALLAPTAVAAAGLTGALLSQPLADLRYEGFD